MCSITFSRIVRPNMTNLSKCSLYFACLIICPFIYACDASKHLCASFANLNLGTTLVYFQKTIVDQGKIVLKEDLKEYAPSRKDFSLNAEFPNFSVIFNIKEIFDEYGSHYPESDIDTSCKNQFLHSHGNYTIALTAPHDAQEKITCAFYYKA